MRLIAHRGGAGLRVENTLAAFGNALALDADGAELDVQLTRDGRVVVHHDAHLNGGYCRDRNGDWLARGREAAIADLDWIDLQRYEIGVPDPVSDYGRTFDRITPVAGQQIPRLRDVIRLVRARSEHFLLVVEIKTPILDAANEPWRPLVDATLGILDEEGFAERAIICAFDWGALRYARAQRPGLLTWFTAVPLSWLGDGQPPPEDLPPDTSYLEALRTLHTAGDAPWFGGFDPRGFAGGFAEAVAAARGNAWFMYHRDCTTDSCHATRRFGLQSAVWSVNLRDSREVARLVSVGVDNLVTDFPDMRVPAIDGNT